MMANKCKPFSDMSEKKGIVKILEKQLYRTDADQREKQSEDKGRHQRTQLSSILDQTGQNSTKWLESALCS